MTTSTQPPPFARFFARTIAVLGSATFSAAVVAQSAPSNAPKGVDDRPAAVTAPSRVDDRGASAAKTTIGNIDRPTVETLIAPTFVVSGWALSRNGIGGVDVVVDGRERLPATLGIARPDVAGAHPDYPDNEAAGFERKLDLSHLPAGQHELEIVAVDRAGGATTIGRRVFVNRAFLDTWAALREARGKRSGDTFHFAFATSHVAQGGAAGVDTAYGPFVSETVRVGVRVPILYLRTTQGRQHDWRFDPDFDTARKCGARSIAEDSLNGVIAWSIAHQVPVLFTLNGGIWADAACDVPDWDVNDWLEQDPLNCQWNEHNEVMPDDYLRHLPGSQDAPELARALTFNVYAQKVRHYKKRNLQQAAAIIKAFADRHPDLFIGVTLDPDVYMNPFFEGAQWYDYNPRTLAQFRDWLRATGPYAGQRQAGVPNLSGYRLKTPYTLEAIGELAGKPYRDWSEVDPPRSFKPEAEKLKAPWAAVWERFRRHLVDLHYDELSQWVAQVGIDRAKIFSSQGFNAPGPGIEPFPLRIDSPPKNYDTGGMSVQGAVPSRGHLGAILYGESAINHIRMEGGGSLFRVFHDFDPDWAVVEYNTANVRAPQSLPGIQRAYRSLRDITNYGARFVSPMAWNGSPGTAQGQPGFTSYTSYRGAPLETAARNVMIHRANLPRQARLWGFGFGASHEDDGWKAIAPARASATGTGLRVDLPASRRIVLASPSAIDFRTTELDLLVVAINGGPTDLRVAVEGRERGKSTWRPLARREEFASLLTTRAGASIALVHTPRQLEQLRLVVESRSGGTLTIRHIALYPVAASR